MSAPVSPSPPVPEDRTLAHVLPFAVFMAFLLVLQFAGSLLQWDHPEAPWWRRDPAQWIYPLQTVVTFVILLHFWKHYEFRWSWKWSLAGAVFGAAGIGLWLLPTTLYDLLGYTGETEGILKWLGVAARTDGFDPGMFESPWAYGTSLTLRFFRAAVVVALVEEIFWRGFLMRFVCDWEGDFWRQPFGKPSWLSYAVVTGCFVLAHTTVDYAGAVVYGSLAYLLCIWSKNLGACVVMHGVANFLMGCYVMAYGKYGLW